MSQPALAAGPPGSLAGAFAAPGSISSAGVSWDPSLRQLYYPDWMEGTWDVEGRLVGVSTPIGTTISSGPNRGRPLLTRTTPGTLKLSLLALPDVGAGMEAPVRFQRRYVRGADGRVTADRPFLWRQVIPAFLKGYAAVESIEYEPERDATRGNVVYLVPRRNGDGIDRFKLELFIQNRAAQDEAGVFRCSESFRQVTQGARYGAVGDYMVLEELVPESTSGSTVGGGGREEGEPATGPSESAAGAPRVVDSVAARQLVAAFLQPQDAEYFYAGGRAVAVYEYAYLMRRAPAEQLEA